MDYQQPPYIPHKGMPPIDYSGKPLSFFEFWPMWAFYPPLIIYVLWLIIRYRQILLPTITNPSFPGGGFFGESKSEILNLANKTISEWVAPFILIERSQSSSLTLEHELNDVISRLEKVKLSFPLVAKPDLGCRGVGVKLIQDSLGLASYLHSFPVGANFILQKLIAFEGEAGVFYCRRPGQPKGRIISLTLKYFPYVTGDGRQTLRQLIQNDPRAGRLSHLYLHRHKDRLESIPMIGENIRLAFAGSHSRGAIFRNGTHLVTSEMEDRFEEISRKLPHFYFGRFDVRFESFEQLQQGSNFVILEVNGAGAESTHIWDRKTSLFHAWRDLIKQYRWLYEIGHENRRQGFTPMKWRDFYKSYRREKMLTKLYPTTD